MALDLEPIKGREAAATPGPWSTEEPGPYVHSISAMDPEGRSFYVAKWLDPATARFIASARTDVPALVAEVEQLREDLRIANDATLVLVSLAAASKVEIERLEAEIDDRDRIVAHAFPVDL